MTNQLCLWNEVQEEQRIKKNTRAKDQVHPLITICRDRRSILFHILAFPDRVPACGHDLRQADGVYQGRLHEFIFHPIHRDCLKLYADEVRRLALWNKTA